MSSITMYYHSPIGDMEITANNDKITSISFVDVVPSSSGQSSTALEQVINQLDEYFAGKRKEFDVNFHLDSTEFQRKVWDKLIEIPYGATISYSQLAGLINNEKGVRAVANAVAANKLAIFIPCHRIIGKDGSLTGYKWGIERKKWLLGHEKG